MKRWWITCSVVFVVGFMIYLYSRYSLCMFSATYNFNDAQHGVVLSIAPGAAISREGITIRYTNNSDRDYDLHPGFTLETKAGNCWVVVPFLPGRGNFFLITYPMPPGSYADIMTLDIQDSFGEIPDGRYRVIRDISHTPENFVPFRHDPPEIFHVAVEFVLDS